MNIVDLGLVYCIEVSPRSVQVRMTMTRAACPITELVVEDMHEQLAAVLPPDMANGVELVWEPPWTPGGMSQAARSIFGLQPERRACLTAPQHNGRRWNDCRFSCLASSH